jgi:acetylornithine deacetylase/succinyl-diaminopimelate desuccinylase-like protein
VNSAEISTLISLLSVPRPNGSQALKNTTEAVRAWLEARGISVQSQRFVLYPYFMELLGLWMALTGLLLPIAALLRWGWGGPTVALLALAVPLLEVYFLRPTITALIRQPAENLVVSFPPSSSPAPVGGHEVILCAHLDSKTEILDHHRRAVLLRLGVPAMGLALVSGILIGVEGFLPAGSAAEVVHWLALLFALPVAIYGLGMGANLIGGRFSRNPSTGAVDNGAAAVILLALAQRLQREELILDRVLVTLLFTVGEEAQMQGALAYVRDREHWPVPIAIVNLEVMGQNGGYVVWERDGTAMLSLPTDPFLNQMLAEVVEEVTGDRPIPAPSISSDAFAFLRRSIPATTLGSFDLELGGRGFHSALDSPDRVHPGRLAETVEILGRFLESTDSNHHLDLEST